MENVDDDASAISSIPLNNSNSIKNLAEINTNLKALILDVDITNKVSQLLSTMFIISISEQRELNENFAKTINNMINNQNLKIQNQEGFIEKMLNMPSEIPDKKIKK